MNSETFTQRKNLLEDFYNGRMKFKIYEIVILQADPHISIYGNMSNIFFKTYITFTNDRFLIGEFYKHFKPIIRYGYSYTTYRKFINENFILIEDNSRINYNYEYDNSELYIKNLEIVLTTHYDFYDEDYDFYFEVLAELEQNNELMVSHTEPINEEVQTVNPFKIFKSEECIICLTNQPIILFCNCGHIPICTECYKLKSLSDCPVCKTENEIIRMLE